MRELLFGLGVLLRRGAGRTGDAADDPLDPARRARHRAGDDGCGHARRHLYASIGLTGPARLLRGETFSLVLGLVGGAVLVVIGARTLWLGVRARVGVRRTRTSRHCVPPSSRRWRRLR